MSKTISKIKGTCRNIQRPGSDVFGEFFLRKYPKNRETPSLSRVASLALGSITYQERGGSNRLVGVR